MNPARLAFALGKARREGREWRCLCPAHDDHDPSLSITEKDGQLLVICRSGCDQDQIINALKARGLWPDPEPRPAARTIIAEYDYVDEHSNLLFQVVRLEPKTFRQRRRQGSEWVWKLDGVDRVPYHLDELACAKAAANGNPWRVFIVEGEKDADRLRSAWHVTATTNPGGAGKWRSQYNHHFSGADAVIIPDNDKTGRDHAAQVAAQLTGTAASVCVLELPELPDKADVSDWLNRGGTQAQLEELLKTARNTPAERQWIRVKGGGLAALLTNTITLLRSTPQWQGLVSFDEFANAVHIRGTPPWSTVPIDQSWCELFNNLATDWVQQHSLGVGRDIVAAAVWTIAHDHSFHPVRDYLNSCHWDGTPRLDGWATTYLGVAPTWQDDQSGYVETVAARWLISAVARVLQPGCKADCALILEGPQDRRKSTALRTLADPWFTDDFSEFGTKDAALETAGVWIIELAELDSINRADTAKIKSFMSRQIDRFRPPYGQFLTNQPRQCVFAGTVNHQEYLRDETGGRRFWPLRCGRILIDLLLEARDQLWAEARDRFVAGERWYLDGHDPPELVAAAQDQQQQRYLPDAWDEIIAQHLAHHALNSISVAEVFTDVIHLDKADWRHPDQLRIARCLRNLGWTRRQTRAGAAREWRYFKHE